MERLFWKRIQKKRAKHGEKKKAFLAFFRCILRTLFGLDGGKPLDSAPFRENAVYKKSVFSQNFYGLALYTGKKK